MAHAEEQVFVFPYKVIFVFSSLSGTFDYFWHILVENVPVLYNKRFTLFGTSREPLAEYSLTAPVEHADHNHLLLPSFQGFY